MRHGMTLLELMIALAIFAMMAAIAAQSLISGSRMSEEVAVASELTEDTHRILHGIADRLRSADYVWIRRNEGEISTYVFPICTGLQLSGDRIGPRFDETYTLIHDRQAGTLAAVISGPSGTGAQQQLATGLRVPDGFEIQSANTGHPELVRGNQVQLRLTRQARLTDGTLVERSAEATVFLRSTIAANTQLTHTPVPPTGDSSNSPPDPGAGDGTAPDPGSGTAPPDGGSSPGTEPPPSAPPPPPPQLVLGEDSDTSQRQVGTGKNKVMANNLLIKGSVSQLAGGDTVIDWESFSLIADKPSNGSQAQYTVRRGWVPSENANKKLTPDEFVIEGWVVGGITFTASVANTAGFTTTVSRSY